MDKTLERAYDLIFLQKSQTSVDYGSHMEQGHLKRGNLTSLLSCILHKDFSAPNYFSLSRARDLRRYQKVRHVQFSSLPFLVESDWQECSSTTLSTVLCW